MFKFLLAAIIFLPPQFLTAQEENWDVYMAQYEKQPSSITINLALKPISPIKDLPFLLVTGVSFKNCDDEGMPQKREFNMLYKISDSVKAIVDGLVKNKLVGTFTHICQRFDYYYLADTLGLREKIAALYKEKFPLYVPYLAIKDDKTWSSYLDFLYPNEESYEFMQNQKMVMALKKGGDKLTKQRPVEHWLYFKTEADRNCFVIYATQQKFKIVAREKVAMPKTPFKLLLSRNDKVDAASITKITIEMKKQAKKCNGDYDGWETFVVK